MIRKIYKGMHYCLNFLNFKPYFGNKEYDVYYRVSFNDDCKYDIDTDQRDVNKLFGVSYGWHHNQSDRVGWRYIPNTTIGEEIEIVLYSYENGKHVTYPVCRVGLCESFNIRFCTAVHNGYRRTYLRIKDKRIMLMHKHNNQRFKWGYTLGAYFGGNRTAPHTMQMIIDKYDDFVLEPLKF